MFRLGFVLPIFELGARSNTYYTALSSVRGDPSGVIIDFEPIEVDVGDLSPLPAEPVCFGQPWLNVFSWDGLAMSGSPRELWELLAPSSTEIASIIPLSLFDLVSACDLEASPAYARTAGKYLEERHGERAARHWLAQSVERNIRIALGRAYFQATAMDLADDEVGFETTLVGRKSVQSQVTLNNIKFQEDALLKAAGLDAAQRVGRLFGLEPRLSFTLPLKPVWEGDAAAPPLNQNWTRIEDEVSRYAEFRLRTHGRSVNVERVATDIAKDAIIRYIAVTGRTQLPADLLDKIKGEASRIIRLRVDRQGAIDRLGGGVHAAGYSGVSIDAGEVVPGRWALTRLSGDNELLAAFKAIMSGEVFSRNIADSISLTLEQVSNVRSRILDAITQPSSKGRRDPRSGLTQFDR